VLDVFLRITCGIVFLWRFFWRNTCQGVLNLSSRLDETVFKGGLDWTADQIQAKRLTNLSISHKVKTSWSETNEIGHTFLYPLPAYVKRLFKRCLIAGKRG
jgi:hypothetical protein